MLDPLRGWSSPSLCYPSGCQSLLVSRTSHAVGDCGLAPVPWGHPPEYWREGGREKEGREREGRGDAVDVCACICVS